MGAMVSPALDPTITRADVPSLRSSVVFLGPPRFAFPDEQNLLASFGAKARVHLVGFEHDGERLGVAADDWKAAKAPWRPLRKARRDARTIGANARDVPPAPPVEPTETKP